MDKTSSETILEYYRGLDAHGSDYVGYSQPTLKEAVTAAARALPGRRVVELGAGPNPIVPFTLAKDGREVTVVEISAGFCETAKLNAERQGVNVTIVCAPAHDAPLEPACADLVILTEVLEHVPDELELATLREARRLVDEQGRFIISVPNAQSWFTRWNTWRSGVNGDENDEHLRKYTVRTLSSKLESAGFAVERPLFVAATNGPFSETRAAWVIDRIAFRPQWGLKAALVARPV